MFLVFVSRKQEKHLSTLVSRDSHENSHIVQETTQFKNNVITEMK